MRNKKKILRYILPCFVVFSFVFIPFFCLAVNFEVDIPDPLKPSAFSSPTKKITEIANKVVEVLYNLLFISSVGFFLFYLYGYFTAGGDSAKIKKVTNRLVLTVVTVALGLVAFSISTIIEKFLTSGGGTPP